ncbi:MAG: tyrosine-type recombinase/integrase [Geobacter sp.]|nr:tyrosine-type recombinase/integrase [Geobacter sp.]
MERPKTTDKRFKFTDEFIRGYALPEVRLEIWDEEIKHLCCRISPTGKKVFQVIGKLNGKTTRVSLGDFPALGVKDARAKARKALVEMSDGINANQQKRQKRADAKEKADSIKSVFEQMIATRTLAKNTLSNYSSSMKHLNKWHALPVTSLTREMVLTQYTTIKSNAVPYAANRVADLLSAICNFSRIITGKPEANPVTVIRDTKARHKESSRDAVLSPTEIKTFLATIENLKGDNARDVMFLILLTGMRKSEAMALQWENVDLDEMTLTVPTTKNGKPLVLPLSLPLVEMLKARWELWQRPGRGSVFPTSGRAGHAVNLDQSSRHIKLEIPHFTPHVLRKTFTTVAAGIGIDGMIIDRLTNHVPRGMTARHYYMPSVEDLREPMQRIADRITELVDPPIVEVGYGLPT